MNPIRRGFFVLGLVLAMVVLPLVAQAGFQTLPASGGQVNDDPPNSIDPTQDAGVSDVAGGSLVAGNPRVPWATFEQVTDTTQQIFVRAFKNGSWVTQGFPASLNIDTSKVAEDPAIDFAGMDRTVPWVSWYEPNDHFGGNRTNVFASRFNASSNLWLPSGQDRTGSSQIPSLNIHTNRTAEEPSVAGGAAVAGNNPVPWVVWREHDGATTDAAGRFQIFVSRGIPAATSCAGVTPPGGPPVNAFCWQQTGLQRLDPTALVSSSTGDPTLNIDPTRNSVAPDITFTGPNDTVPWTVWYEEDPSGIGLANSDMIFAAKAVSDATPGAGGFHWQAVGNGTAGKTRILDTSGTNGFGGCANSIASEKGCTLNKDSSANAEDPRVATGTLTPGGPTVPWVTWQEEIGGGRHAIFVSRLVNGDHFELFNSGQPISNTLNDATNPDITFSGNEPYVSWQENVSGVQRAFLGHFEGGAAAPVFRLDTPTGIAKSSFGLSPDLLPPISSSCTADPFTSDGSACQGGAAGTPFFLFTDGPVGGQKLFARGYKPDRVVTKAATNVSSTSAKLHASIDPGGSVVLVHFDFGTTTAYGQTTPTVRLGPATTAQSFAQTISGLASGTKYHFRVVVSTDFDTFLGADRSFTTL
jgi:hypothetical protein